MTPPLIPVILSGGAGTRLWPLSREASPKPFIQLSDGQTLLQKAFLLAKSLAGVSDILTVTHREYYFRTKEEYESLSGKQVSLSYLLEPEARNTAFAICMAAFFLEQQHGPDTVMLVMPADHLIKNTQAFQSAVKVAIEAAQQNALVTFGIPPSAPETGYGYIETIDPNLNTLCKAKQFVEKPDRALAETYLKSGHHFWNSGLFCFTAKTVLSEMKRYAPTVFEAAILCAKKSFSSELFPKVVELNSTAGPNISIDYALMEKSENVRVVPCDIGWSDIGSWKVFSALGIPDSHGNHVQGEALLYEVMNTYVHSKNRLVAAIGVKDLIIVDTEDAILVTHRECAEEVRQVVQQLRLQNHESYKFPRTIYRPWGMFTILEEGQGFKVKRLVVKPGKTLSLQLHYHRSEHWVVVEGRAKVVHGENTFFLNVNESTYIPVGHKHRLENPEEVDLIVIEVQSGTYLGEDDIVRFEYA